MPGKRARAGIIAILVIVLVIIGIIVAGPGVIKALQSMHKIPQH